MIQTRLATTKDIPALAKLELVIFPEDPWTEGMFKGEFSGTNDTIYLVLEDCGEGDGRTDGAVSRVIGYAGIWIILDEGHITNVGVHPDYRRQHLAERLVTELLAKAEEKGAVRETLEVRKSNEPAIRLYEKLGFVYAGTRRGYYPDNHEDALIYWREK